MANKVKKRFINVEPKTFRAKIDFMDYMDSLHAMVVKEETETHFFVLSINNKYGFWLNKKDDMNWKVLK